MIRIQQVKVPLAHKEADIVKKACKMLRQKETEVLEYRIVKQSVDARKREQVSYVYTIDLRFPNEEKILQKLHVPWAAPAKDVPYCFPDSGKALHGHPPVIVGSGPAGLFAAYELAVHGYAPLVIERGRDVEQRTKDVEAFWTFGDLQKNSNVQFGEGGAGTFSDGKLNTLVKDVAGRNRHVLELFVKAGAPEDILYVNKPHIGTDILKKVVKSLREEILDMGGTFAFETQLTGIRVKDGVLQAIEVNGDRWMDTEILILAIGHSARDTFEMLEQTGLHMEAKSFAVGMRVEHPQKMIDECQYKGADTRYLPTASYKLTANLDNGRGVYSFCMCPGGYVVNASSEEEMLAVNGMSYHDRNGENANSAIIVSVTPADYPGEGPLKGVAFQRELERRAYRIGGGKIPQQLFGDFERNQISEDYGAFSSTAKGLTAFANLREIFPEEVSKSFIEGMHRFAKYIPEYDREDAILSGVESRTSSPVRISRNELFESNIPGIYPCGEGAGYAGGIMSAAMDGLKVAEAVAAKYAPGFREEGE